MAELFLQSISIVLYEAICCNIFLGTFLKPRFSSRWIRALSVILLAGSFALMAVFTISKWQYIVRIIGAVLCIFLFSIVFYVGKWHMKLFFCGTFYAILCGLDYFCIILLDMIFKRDYLNSDVAEVLVVLLCKTILFVLVLVFDHVWKRKKLKLDNPAWILMICHPLFSLVLLLVMMFSFLGNQNRVGYLIVSFGVMIINLVMFEWLKFISERNEKWGQIQVLQERNEERIQLYQEIGADYEEQKRVLHDYKNQINCIQGLLCQHQYKEAEEYAEKLVDTLPNPFGNVDVQNPIINIVLNQKYRLAKAKGISMIFYANNLSDLWLEEQDTVSLLANLIDNAIEACEEIEGEKQIYIKLVREKKEFVISIRNPVEKPVKIESGQIASHKPDKNRHGIGLRNVRMVLDKYDGMGMMRYEEGYFYYTAVLPELKF